MENFPKEFRELQEYLQHPSKRLKRHKTAFTSVAVEDLGENLLWKNEVQEKCVPCCIVGVDDLLDAERALVADLRYLWLQYVGRTTSLSDVVKMKKNRYNGEADLERPYYSPALTITQASVEGQHKAHVLSEVHTKGDGARGDLRVYVDDEECPSVMKAVNGSSNPSTDPEGICSNTAAFGKLLKIIRTKLVNGNIWISNWRELYLGYMHRRFLHRDVKLENMLLIDEQLVLHDFDVGCRSDALWKLSQYVGTAAYRSSFGKREPYLYLR